MDEAGRRARQVECDVCTAGKGQPCYNLNSTGTHFGRLTLLHVHKERRAKARAKGLLVRKMPKGAGE